MWSSVAEAFWRARGALADELGARRPPRRVEVPDLTGLTYPEAAWETTRVGLGIRVRERRGPDGRPAVVTSQDPGPSVPLRRRRKVAVTLSSEA